MASGTMRHLWRALDFKLSEVLQVDFFAGLLAGAASVWLGLTSPVALLAVVFVASGLVGVIIGAVIAGVSIQVAFMDQPFLRKLRAINRDPVRYMAPFLFTAVLGVLALLSLLVLATLRVTTPRAALGIVGGIAGFTTVWTTASLLPCLATLVQFMDLKGEALDVPDDIDVPRRRNASG